MVVCLLPVSVYWNLGLRAVILQLMRPTDTHKLQPYFWKQTMLSPQYAQALIGVTHATCTRSNSLACRLLHSDTFIFSDSTAGWAWREAGCLTHNCFSGRSGAVWRLHFSGEVWCDACASTPLGECVPGTTGTEGARQSENRSANSRNGLRWSMYV